MEFVEIFLIAVGLAMDAFAVSLAAGASGRAMGFRFTFRLSFHFGLFQFLMPLAGWALGIQVASLVASFGKWVAFGLLAFVGIRMVLGAFDGRPLSQRRDPSRGLTLVALCLGTSIDAMAVGMSLALLGISIWYPSAIIGLVTALLCVMGIKMGTLLGRAFGARMEMAGGILLVLIGLRILIS